MSLKCPSCGSDYTILKDSYEYYCEHCQNVFRVIDNYDNDYNSLLDPDSRIAFISKPKKISIGEEIKVNTGLAKYYLKTNNMSSYIKTKIKITEYLKEMGDIFNVGKTYYRLGLDLKEKDFPVSSRKFFKRAIASFNECYKIDSISPICIIYHRLLCYIELEDTNKILTQLKAVIRSRYNKTKQSQEEIYWSVQLLERIIKFFQKRQIHRIIFKCYERLLHIFTVLEEYSSFYAMCKQAGNYAYSVKKYKMAQKYYVNALRNILQIRPILHYKKLISKAFNLTKINMKYILRIIGTLYMKMEPHNKTHTLFKEALKVDECKTYRQLEDIKDITLILLNCAEEDPFR